MSFKPTGILLASYIVGTAAGWPHAPWWIGAVMGVIFGLFGDSIFEWSRK